MTSSVHGGGSPASRLLRIRSLSMHQSKKALTGSLISSPTSASRYGLSSFKAIGCGIVTSSSTINPDCTQIQRRFKLPIADRRTTGAAGLPASRVRRLTRWIETGSARVGLVQSVRFRSGVNSAGGSLVFPLRSTKRRRPTYFLAEGWGAGRIVPRAWSPHPGDQGFIS